MLKLYFVEKNQKQILFECIYVLTFPIIVWSLYGISIFNNNEGFLDAWIYFGYIHNFQDLYDRYGLPYYSVRFGLIYPNIILTQMFGALGGYISFVYIMYLLAGIPLYLLFRQLYSVHAAILAYAILASSAWFGRAVLWTHPDAAAVPYLISAFSLLLIESKYRRTLNIIAGLLIALAVNSNVFAISIAGLFVVSCASYFQHSIRARLKNELPWFMAGFFLIFILGAGGFALCCNSPNYFSSTISMIQWGHDGNAAVYQQPWSDLLKLSAIYLPVFLVIFTHYISKRSINNKLLIACRNYVLAVILFEVMYRIFVPSALLELFYYYSFVLAACAISLSLVPVSLAYAGDVRSRALHLNIVLAVYMLVPLLISYSGLSFAKKVSPSWIILGFVVSFYLMRSCNKHRYLTPFAIIIFSISSQLSLLSTLYQGVPFYAKMYSKEVDINLGNYRLGLKFISAMPVYSETKKPIYFWYKNSDQLGNSLQSTYLWGYSRLMDSSPNTYGLPELKGINPDMLKSPASLVLFDRDSSNIDIALANLKEYGLKFEVDSTQEICERDICYVVKVLNTDSLAVPVN